MKIAQWLIERMQQISLSRTKKKPNKNSNKLKAVKYHKAWAWNENRFRRVYPKIKKAA